MSRYAVYKLFGDSSAPGNIMSCGHIAGVIEGEYDENPLYICPPSYMTRRCKVRNESDSRYDNVNIKED